MKKTLIVLLSISFILLMVASCKKANAPQYTTINDYDGNIYKIFKIGNQYWMSANLRVTHYADGTPLINGSHVSATDTSRAYFYYNGDSTYLYDYGYFYTWAAVMRGSASSSASPSGVQGPCPNGFHVPSNAEWQTLINYLGGANLAGGAMKGFSYWGSNNVGYNSTTTSGFDALPSGFRNVAGLYGGREVYAYLWSTTQVDSADVNDIVIYAGSAAVSDTSINAGSAVSCRCLQN